MHDDRRSSAERGYGAKWQRARAAWIQMHPLCVDCERRGAITAAAVVDHIVPHRLNEALESGNAGRIKAAQALFWDRKNWQSLCKPCHDSHKQRLEKSGRVLGCGVDGRPADPSHHWNL